MREVHPPHPEDLEVLAGTPLMTGQYQRFKPDDGVAIRSTVGEPKWWRHGPLPHCRDATPYGLMDPKMSDAEAERRYLIRLDERAGSIIGFLADVARLNPGRPLVIL